MIQPLHKHVLLQEEMIEKATTSGILLSTEKEKSEFARVIAIAEDLVDCGYEVNDLVLYNMHNVRYITLEGNTYMIVEDSDIIAKK